jgi:hypothetical protein
MCIFTRSIVPFRLGGLFRANCLLTSIIRQIPPISLQNLHVWSRKTEFCNVHAQTRKDTLYDD